MEDQTSGEQDVNSLRKPEYTNLQSGFISRLLDIAPDGIVAINEQGEIILFNKQAEALFGYKHDEIIGKQVDVLIPGQFHQTHIRHIESYFTNPTTRAMGAAKKELLGRRKNGAEFPIDISLSYLQTATEKIGISAIRDTTERKIVEQRLELQNTELKKINSELDRFVYSTSHDLRAPLMSVLGLVDLCMGTENKQEIREYLDMMKSSIYRIDNTINEILVYSRNSRMELNIEELDITTIVNNVIEGINHISGAQNISFTINIKNEIPFFSDRLRITALFNNLITNAVKYQRQEEARPFVKCSFTSNADEGIIAIEDNGEGIAADKIDRIFEMFYRNSHKSVGSGLGLYICKEIVNKMGGSIHVTSVPGKGSTFYIHLPNNKPGDPTRNQFN